MNYIGLRDDLVKTEPPNCSDFTQKKFAFSQQCVSGDDWWVVHTVTQGLVLTEAPPFSSCFTWKLGSTAERVLKDLGPEVKSLTRSN